MEKYEKPSMEVVEIKNQVITASCNPVDTINSGDGCSCDIVNMGGGCSIVNPR